MPSTIVLDKRNPAGARGPTGLFLARLMASATSPELDVSQTLAPKTHVGHKRALALVGFRGAHTFRSCAGVSPAQRRLPVPCARLENRIGALHPEKGAFDRR